MIMKNSVRLLIARIDAVAVLHSAVDNVAELRQTQTLGKVARANEIADKLDVHSIHRRVAVPLAPRVVMVHIGQQQNDPGHHLDRRFVVGARWLTDAVDVAGKLSARQG